MKTPTSAQTAYHKMLIASQRQLDLEAARARRWDAAMLFVLGACAVVGVVIVLMILP